MVKKSVIITLLALLLIGCSTERQCARAAKKCAHLWHSDTAYVHDSVTIERTITDTLLRWQTLRERDTVTIRDGRATVRIVRLPGDSIWVQGECGDTVIRYVRQVVTKNVQQKFSVRQMLPLIWLFLIVIMCLLSIAHNEGWSFLRRRKN
jgi:hypothetical protein